MFTLTCLEKHHALIGSVLHLKGCPRNVPSTGAKRDKRRRRGWEGGCGGERGGWLLLLLVVTGGRGAGSGGAQPPVRRSRLPGLQHCTTQSVPAAAPPSAPHYHQDRISCSAKSSVAGALEMCGLPPILGEGGWKKMCLWWPARYVTGVIRLCIEIQNKAPVTWLSSQLINVTLPLHSWCDTVMFSPDSLMGRYQVCDLQWGKDFSNFKSYPTAGFQCSCVKFLENLQLKHRNMF